MYDIFFDLYGVYKFFVINFIYFIFVVGWMSVGVEELIFIGVFFFDLD